MTSKEQWILIGVIILLLFIGGAMAMRAPAVTTSTATTPRTAPSTTRLATFQAPSQIASGTSIVQSRLTTVAGTQTVKGSSQPLYPTYLG